MSALRFFKTMGKRWNFLYMYSCLFLYVYSNYLCNKCSIIVQYLYLGM